MHYFSSQVPPVPYSEVRSKRLLWKKKRENYRRHGYDQPFNTHFYTVASENKTELQNLEFTAMMAGVDLHILGIGRKYTSWLQKLEWYAEALLDEDKNNVEDDDILVMIDAYDVLLTPMVRQIALRLSQSPTPLVACSENGQYPEPEAPWFYPREAILSFSSDIPHHSEVPQNDELRRVGGTTRFLNSGCLAGRGKDMKDFLNKIYHEMTLVRDDQQVYVRYFLRNPHIISVDSESLVAVGPSSLKQQTSIFQCGWRVPQSAFTELSYTGVAKFYGNFLPVGIFHMNNRQSEPLYHTLVSMFRNLYEACFAGKYGSQMLQALHLVIDGNDAKAESILSNIIVASAHSGLLSRVEEICIENIRHKHGLSM